MSVWIEGVRGRGWEIRGIRSTMEVGWMEGGRDGW